MIERHRTIGVRRPRVHLPLHLQFVRSLECLFTGDNTSVEAAHIRYGDLRFGKKQSGIGEKSDDMWVLPLCGLVHQHGKKAQHSSGERQWWEERKVDATLYAAAIFMNSGDAETCTRILHHARAGANIPQEWLR